MSRRPTQVAIEIWRPCQQARGREKKKNLYGKVSREAKESGGLFWTVLDWTVLENSFQNPFVVFVWIFLLVNPFGSQNQKRAKATYVHLPSMTKANQVIQGTNASEWGVSAPMVHDHWRPNRQLCTKKQIQKFSNGGFQRRKPRIFPEKSLSLFQRLEGC